MTIEYTEALADTICERLMDGESMRSICSDEGMPSRTTLFRWMTDNEEFGTKCARAREIQADAIFDKMQEVADTENAEDVQRAKLRVSTMQWRASKLAPKRYGDKLDLSHSGTVTLAPEQRQAEIDRLLAKRIGSE